MQISYGDPLSDVLSANPFRLTSMQAKRKWTDEGNYFEGSVGNFFVYVKEPIRSRPEDRVITKSWSINMANQMRNEPTYYLPNRS